MRLPRQATIVTPGDFPLFADGVRLHRTPLGGYVVFCRPGRDQSSLVALSDQEIAALLQIDGATDLSGILSYACDGGGDAGAAREALMELLASLANAGALRFGSIPQRRPPRVSGAKDCFIPFHMIVELGARCNLTCRHCYADAVSCADAMMSETLALSIMREASTLGVESLQLSGGEPTLHASFDRILHAASEMFPQVAVSTNGTLLDAVRVGLFSSMEDRLTVQISLDGPNAEIHDSVRGVPGAFDKALDALRRLVLNGVRVTACVSVFPDTVPFLRKTAELLVTVGVRQLRYVPVLHWGKGKTVRWESLSQTDCRHHFFSERALYEQSGIPIDYIAPWELESMRPNCGAGTRLVCVDPVGAVLPCPTIRRALGCCTQHSLREILSQEKLKCLSVLPAPSLDECEGCDFRDYCAHCLSRGIDKAQSAQARCRWYMHNTAVIQDLGGRSCHGESTP